MACSCDFVYSQAQVCLLVREIKKIGYCNVVSFMRELGRMGFCGLDTMFVFVAVFMFMGSDGWCMLNGQKLIQ